MTQPMLSLVGFLIGALIWACGLYFDFRPARFMGMGFTIGHGVMFVIFCVALS